VIRPARGDAARLLYHLGISKSMPSDNRELSPHRLWTEWREGPVLETRFLDAIQELEKGWAGRRLLASMGPRMEYCSVEILIGGQRANEGPVMRTAYLTRPAGGVDVERDDNFLVFGIDTDIVESSSGARSRK
jgi:hypothetical protein